MAEDGTLLSAILALLYETALDSSCWDEFLRLVTEAVQGDSAMLLMHDVEKGTSSVAKLWNGDPEGAKLFNEHYFALDVWRRGVADRLHTNWVGPSDVVVPFDRLQRTEFHGDFLSRQDIDHALFAIVDQKDMRAMNLSVYRSRRRGQFTEENVELLNRINPHLKRALRLHFELADARGIRSGLESALDAISLGIVLLNEKNKILLMNHAAQQILSHNEGLLAARRELKAEQPDERNKLEVLLARCVRPGPTEDSDAGGAALLISRRTRQPLQVFVSPIRGATVAWGPAAAIIVLINDPQQRVRPAHEFLRKLFGLTPAECRLASLLADGRSTREIMSVVGVSANTIKSQLSAIFVKTGTSRQAQLVKMLTLLPNQSDR